MEFRGERVTLKELSHEQFDAYMKMFSSTVKQMLHLTNDESERGYLQHCLMEHKKRRYFFFCIFDNKDDCLIGSIGLRSPLDTRGQLGAWINENYWGSGRYQEALKLLLNAYFERSGVDVVTLHVYAHNVRSYKAHKNFGFIDVATIDGPYGKQYVLAYKRRYK